MRIKLPIPIKSEKDELKSYSLVSAKEKSPSVEGFSPNLHPNTLSKEMKQMSASEPDVSMEKRELIHLEFEENSMDSVGALGQMKAVKRSSYKVSQIKSLDNFEATHENFISDSQLHSRVGSAVSFSQTNFFKPGAYKTDNSFHERSNSTLSAEEELGSCTFNFTPLLNVVDESPTFNAPTSRALMKSLRSDSCSSTKEIEPTPISKKQSNSSNFSIGSVSSFDESTPRNLFATNKENNKTLNTNKGDVYKQLKFAKKPLGTIYLKDEQFKDMKSRVMNLLFVALDLKEDSSSADISGYRWLSYNNAVCETVNGKKLIKAASLPCLIHILISGISLDHDFLSDFLRTYRYAGESLDVARLLILTYIDAKNAAAVDLDSTFEKKVNESNIQMTLEERCNNIQMKILNILKKWIGEHSCDFERDTVLCALMKTFLNAKVQTDPKKAPFAVRMLEQLQAFNTNTQKIPYFTTKSSSEVSNADYQKPSMELRLSKTEINLDIPLLTSRDSIIELENNKVKSPRRIKISTKPVESSSINLNSYHLDPKPPISENSSVLSDNLFKQTSLLSFSNSENQNFVEDDEATYKESKNISLNMAVLNRNLSETPASDSLFSPVSQSTSYTSSSAPTSPTRSSVGSYIQPQLFPKAERPKTIGGYHGLKFIIMGTAYELQPKLNKISILDFDSEDLAKQITLIEHKLFREIPLHEFYCQSWNDKTYLKSPNLVKLINWFNHMSLGFASEVVRQHDLKKRVGVLKKLIFTAHCCVNWVCCEGSYRTYRSSLSTLKAASGSAPMLPYIGISLSDLTFTEDGNPTFVTEGGENNSLSVINFSKLRMISQILSTISEQLRSPHYQFTCQSNVQDWLLEEMHIMTESELYTQSKLCEPKGVTA
ncbi:Ras protein-specific guanine nucleotide-releasing factor [Clydaea vesicula]|uniref:Ras protein-specific guanine nucleotide-releasing factor n=1 Tax=Clydaea vesicula TaxID=447962 RepID=A0AAD5U9M4_9FUNG|nr:Ras protein-specific guanine nucleotide-releasing factor [Clydaea vesicula]